MTYLRFDRLRRAPKRWPPRSRIPIVQDSAAARPARGTFSISSHFRGFIRHHRVRQIIYFLILTNETVRETNDERVIHYYRYDYLDIARFVLKKKKQKFVSCFGHVRGFTIIRAVTWRSFRDRFDHVQCARRRANHNWRCTEPWSSSRCGRPGLAITTAAAVIGSWPVIGGGPHRHRWQDDRHKKFHPTKRLKNTWIYMVPSNFLTNNNIIQ